MEKCKTRKYSIHFVGKPGSIKPCSNTEAADETALKQG
jgi:hypothetical protein